MSTRAIHLKAAGAICDGHYRDSAGIAKLGFPTFGLGAYAQDQGPRGKVVDFGVPIEIGGIRIAIEGGMSTVEAFECFGVM